MSGCSGRRRGLVVERNAVTVGAPKIRLIMRRKGSNGTYMDWTTTTTTTHLHQVLATNK
jgi:hypothetical protein